MKFLHASEVEKENYKLLSGSILPRPIALVTTLQENKVVNAAPFSYFNIVSAEPPLISISVRYDTTDQKDTSRNIFREKEFVVHIISEDFVKEANKTSKPMAQDESEIEYAGLHLVESTLVTVPGIQEARVRLECVYKQHLHLETTDLIIGRVVGFHIDDDVFDNGKINLEQLNPVSRLSGSRYGTIGKIIPIPKEK